MDFRPCSAGFSAQNLTGSAASIPRLAFILSNRAHDLMPGAPGDQKQPCHSHLPTPTATPGCLAKTPSGLRFL